MLLRDTFVLYVAEMQHQHCAAVSSIVDHSSMLNYKSRFFSIDVLQLFFVSGAGQWARALKLPGQLGSLQLNGDARKFCCGSLRACFLANEKMTQEKNFSFTVTELKG